MFSSEFATRSSRNIFTYQEVMASISGSSSKVKKGFEMLVKGVEWKMPNFKLATGIAESLEPHGAQSQIPPEV